MPRQKYLILKEKILRWLDEILKNIWKEKRVEVILTEIDNKHRDFIEKTVDTELSRRGLFGIFWDDGKEVNLRVTTEDEDLGWPH